MSRRPSPRAGRWPRRLAAGAAALVVGLVLSFLGAAYLIDFPVERLAPEAATSLVLTDRHGSTLRESPLPGGGRARWIGLDQIAPALVQATLAGEDHRFFLHHGLDARALLRAVWLGARHGRVVSGASTLTMQLARLLEPEPRSLARKVHEAVLAVRLERAASKPVILEQYLNRAYYGAGAVGVEAAAQRFFGRSASALSAGQAALLAVLPRAPSAYDPLRHLEAARARRAHVLGLMVERGLLTETARQAIEAEPLALVGGPSPTRAPHFVAWALAQLPPEAQHRGGVLHTTLDLPLQERLEAAVHAHVAARRPRGLEQAGLVVLDPATGAVRAMVGSTDFSGDDGQVNITTTPRHPGSALKPFVYALALERGDTPATLAVDARDPASAWMPDRPQREHGLVRYRESLAGSYNLAAVHVLESVGVEALLERLRRAGVGPLPGTAADYGPALALGAGKVRLVELAAAYAFLVEGGRVARPRAFEDGAGGTVDGWRAVEDRTGDGAPGAPASVRLFSPQVAWLVMDMLSDPDARRSVFGAELPVDLPFRAAVKTGTSGGFADTVAVGATREAIVAAWAGAFDGSGTKGSLAMWSAAPLVRAGLLAVADGRPLTLPPAPEGIVAADVCRVSGLRPGPACPHKREWFVQGSAPGPTCGQDHLGAHSPARGGGKS